MLVVLVVRIHQLLNHGMQETVVILVQLVTLVPVKFIRLDLAAVVVQLVLQDQRERQEMQVELEQLDHLELLAELVHLVLQDQADHKATL